MHATQRIADETGSGPLRVLIGEDDPQQLELLVASVARLRPQWVLLQASSAAEVRDVLAGECPDLAILDVRLGSDTSLEIMRFDNLRPPCIFVTGDPIFAVDAFECDAVDFLLKPVRAARLEQALAKAQARLDAPVGAPASEGKASVCMFRGTALAWASLDEVDYFLADRKYTRVMVRAGWEGLLRMGISAVEEALAGSRFRRIHRGAIVHLGQIESTRRDSTGRLVLRLRGRPDVLPVSRPYEHAFVGEGFR